MLSAVSSRQWLELTVETHRRPRRLARDGDGQASTSKDPGAGRSSLSAPLSGDDDGEDLLSDELEDDVKPANIGELDEAAHQAAQTLMLGSPAALAATPSTSSSSVPPPPPAPAVAADVSSALPPLNLQWDSARMAALYVARMHHYLPLISPQVKITQAYLKARAFAGSGALAMGLSILVDPAGSQRQGVDPRAVLNRLSRASNANAHPFSEQGLDALADIQGAICAAHAAYGTQHPDVARGLLSWLISRITQLSYPTLDRDFPAPPTGEPFETALARSYQRSAFWEVWALEAFLSVVTGERDFTLRDYLVHSHIAPFPPTNLPDAMPANLARTRAIAFLAECSDPTIDETPLPVPSLQAGMPGATRHERLRAVAEEVWRESYRAYLDARSESLALQQTSADETVLVMARVARERALMACLVCCGAEVFLEAASSLLSVLLAPAFSCGLDTTARPQDAAGLAVVARVADRVFEILRLEDTAASEQRIDEMPTALPPHCAFFGCSCIIGGHARLLTSTTPGSPSAKSPEAPGILGMNMQSPASIAESSASNAEDIAHDFDVLDRALARHGSAWTCALPLAEKVKSMRRAVLNATTNGTTSSPGRNLDSILNAPSPGGHSRSRNVTEDVEMSLFGL